MQLINGYVWAMRLWDASRVLEDIAIDDINKAKRVCFRGALSPAPFLRNCCNTSLQVNTIFSQTCRRFPALIVRRSGTTLTVYWALSVSRHHSSWLMIIFKVFSVGLHFVFCFSKICRRCTILQSAVGIDHHCLLIFHHSFFYRSSQIILYSAAKIHLHSSVCIFLSPLILHYS